MDLSGENWGKKHGWLGRSNGCNACPACYIAQILEPIEFWENVDRTHAWIGRWLECKTHDEDDCDICRFDTAKGYRED
jgi:hypothetical protein